jgi:hypothetical protein
MTKPAPPDPVPVDLTTDGTTWVEWLHLTGRKRWQRFAGFTSDGHVLLPPLAFDLSEAAVAQDLDQDRGIPFRRRESRLYVSTDYLVGLFPDDELRIEYVEEAVRRAVSTLRKTL